VWLSRWVVIQHILSLYIVPLMGHTIVVCISNIIPIPIECFIWVNINLIVFIDISSFVISGSILYKILVLGINEIVLTFPLKF
jgi:hypothetical protein